MCLPVHCSGIRVDLPHPYFDTNTIACFWQFDIHFEPHTQHICRHTKHFLIGLTAMFACQPDTLSIIVPRQLCRKAIFLAYQSTFRILNVRFQNWGHPLIVIQSNYNAATHLDWGHTDRCDTFLLLHFCGASALSPIEVARNIAIRMHWAATVKIWVALLQYSNE